MSVAPFEAQQSGVSSVGRRLQDTAAATGEVSGALGNARPAGSSLPPALQFALPVLEMLLQKLFGGGSDGQERYDKLGTATDLAGLNYGVTDDASARGFDATTANNPLGTTPLSPGNVPSLPDTLPGSTPQVPTGPDPRTDGITGEGDGTGSGTGGGAGDLPGSGAGGQAPDGVTVGADGRLLGPDGRPLPTDGSGLPVLDGVHLDPSTGQPLSYDPATGQYYNPVTGQRFGTPQSGGATTAGFGGGAGVQPAFAQVPGALGAGPGLGGPGAGSLLPVPAGAQGAGAAFPAGLGAPGSAGAVAGPGQGLGPAGMPLGGLGAPMGAGPGDSRRRPGLAGPGDDGSGAPDDFGAPEPEEPAAVPAVADGASGTDPALAGPWSAADGSAAVPTAAVATAAGPAGVLPVLPPTGSGPVGAPPGSGAAAPGAGLGAGLPMAFGGYPPADVRGGARGRRPADADTDGDQLVGATDDDGPDVAVVPASRRGTAGVPSPAAHLPTAWTAAATADAPVSGHPGSSAHVRLALPPPAGHPRRQAPRGRPPADPSDPTGAAGTGGADDRVPALPPLPDGVAVDPGSGRVTAADGKALPVDPVTGLPVLHGQLLDPFTGRPPAAAARPGLIVDPVTGLDLDPATGALSDPSTGQELQRDAFSGFLVHPVTGALVAESTGLHYDADSGRVIDPATGAGLAIDRPSGLLVDAVTGELVDPETGRVLDRSTGEPLPRDPASGLLVLGGSTLLDPRTGRRYDRATGHRITA